MREARRDMTDNPDFHFLRQIVELPVMLGLAIVFGLGLRTRIRKAGTVVAAAAGILLYASATPLVGSALLRTLDRAETGDPAASPPDAIVILSANGRVTQDGKLAVGHLTLERLRQGAHLHRATGLPVLVAGGVLKDFPEALSSAMAASLAEDFRLGPVWQEDRSRTTAENARFSSELLSARGIGSAYLVTHSWHMPRAAKAFRRAGLSVVPAPVEPSQPNKRTEFSDFLPTASGLQASQYAVHEWIGQLWYDINQFQELPSH
jgi:uncharacterized SAM-binding protein YcdF (DUF218 family)